MTASHGKALQRQRAEERGIEWKRRDEERGGGRKKKKEEEEARKRRVDVGDRSERE